MYRNIWFIFILSLLNCHGENKFQVNDHMDDFNEIIEAVIRYDTLKVFKNNKENDVINDYLKKIPIVNPLKPHKDSLAFVTPPGSKTLDELFYFSSADYKGFTDKESLYLLSQNSNPDSLKIPSQLLSKIKHLNNKQISRQWEKGNCVPYYTFKIPIISKDRSKSYLEYYYNCGGLCGYGKGYFLERKNGKWNVTQKWLVWIS
jgi:hypothetical protein